MQNADSKGQAGAAANSSTKDEITSVSQHSRKPPAAFVLFVTFYLQVLFEFRKLIRRIYRKNVF